MGLLHGRRYTFKWSTLLVWLCVVEGATRAVSDTGASARLAMLEIALAIVFFASAAAWLRMTRERRETSR
jgi:uncharacterized membrane protein